MSAPATLPPPELVGGTAGYAVFVRVADRRATERDNTCACGCGRELGVRECLAIRNGSAFVRGHEGRR